MISWPYIKWNACLFILPGKLYVCTTETILRNQIKSEYDSSQTDLISHFLTADRPICLI